MPTEMTPRGSLGLEQYSSAKRPSHPRPSPVFAPSRTPNEKMSWLVKWDWFGLRVAHLLHDVQVALVPDRLHRGQVVVQLRIRHSASCRFVPTGTVLHAG